MPRKRGIIAVPAEAGTQSGSFIAKLAN
jgi:hypothetical protein